MKPSENSDLRAATIGKAKSTGYFMKLRDWPEFDLIHPAGANRLIAGSKTVRTIGLDFSLIKASAAFDTLCNYGAIAA